MRLLLITAIAAASASTALAAPAAIQVRISPALQVEATKTYGPREVQWLADDLKRLVGQRLDATGVLDGAQVELTLVDAKPNRPTMQQMRDKPGLSYLSHGVGGARIEGKATSVDGTVTPISYQWYETDIRNSWYQSTWGDAETAFQRLASRLARGETFASR
ncbi:hypothetical protein [Phenylobacterium aquaticum]|uniref:hypothetical protein n=1 Tax=Phenylobacterium aquaticum TaxID=1763816 RepID=UPI0026F065BD|nr:hypothetical protein [Phenylobacterium aquaticum]